MQRAEIDDILHKARSLRVLCLGDLILDRFIDGQASGVSREAPVLSFRVNGERTMPGGAANAARNLASLGAQVRLLGVVGDDPDAGQLQQLIDGETGLFAQLLVDEGRATSTKIRYVASGHQTFSVDQDADMATSGSLEDALIAAALGSLNDVQGVVLSDYGRGCLSPRVLRSVLDAARDQGKPVMIDPRGSDYRRYDGASLIKPNAAELSAVTGMQVEDDATVEAALRHLQARLGETETLIVTRGASGMSILGGDGKVHKVPAQRRTVFDVSGAGDTTLAALTLARLAGLSWFDAAQFATLCAGIAVSKAGTAVVSPDEIREDLMRTPTAGADYLPLDQLAGTLQRWRVEGLRIGLTNGCFDVLHLGHLQALEGARRYCDRLLVALNDDESVRQLKGEGRPVNSLADRAGLLAGLRPVDLVTSFSGPTADAVVRAVKPDVYVKSGDYAPQTLPEAAAVREAGGEVIIVPFLEGRSTTAMLERARKG